MPTVSVLPNDLWSNIGAHYNIEEFQDLCFQFGIEFDGEETGDDGSIWYRIEVPANRIDLLSVEGIGRALSVFTGRSLPPQYKLLPSTPNSQYTMVVKAPTARIRPYCYAAILRGVTFTPSTYKSFIDLQDKLHHNIARRRQLVAIGTHDLSTIKGPFIYTAEDPKKINFIPLNQTQKVDGLGMMEVLSNHAQLKTYLPIIRDSPVYPVIRDSNGIILSVPPIINGEHSKITLQTRDIFIEITAKDRTKGSMVLHSLVALFSQYCEKPFHVEPVLVEYDKDHPIMGGQSFINPDFKGSELRANINYIRKVIGVEDLTTHKACELLTRMMILSIPDPYDTSTIISKVPITRGDVLHACDLAEDVAIAYGFNNIKSREFYSVHEQPYMALSSKTLYLITEMKRLCSSIIRKDICRDSTDKDASTYVSLLLYSDQLRTELANCSYRETLTWGLCSIKEGFEFLGRQWRKSAESPFGDSEYDSLSPPVHLLNPKTREFEIARTSLIPGLLKALTANKAQELPLRLFELGDVISIDLKTETRTRSSRYCAALMANNNGSCLEYIHGLLDILLRKLALLPEYHELQIGSRNTTNTIDKTPRIYKLELSRDDQAFLPGRCVRIMVQPDNIQLGVMGVLHPSVLKAFGVTLPCSVFEFTLEPFLKWLPETMLYDE